MSNHIFEKWFAKHDDGQYRNPDHWSTPDHAKHVYSSAAPVVDSKGNLVAYICGATSSSKGFSAIDEIIEPRARLIAAAPELLDALKGMLCWPNTPSPEAVRKAQAALAKAIGDTDE